MGGTLSCDFYCTWQSRANLEAFAMGHTVRLLLEASKSRVSGYEVVAASLEVSPEKFAPGRLCTCMPGWCLGPIHPCLHRLLCRSLKPKPE